MTHMKLYNLMLFKKTGTKGLAKVSGRGCLDKRYSVLGYYDHLCLEELSSVSNIYSDEMIKCDTREDPNYRIHSMTLFTLPDFGGSDKALVSDVENGNCAQFITVISCVMRKYYPDRTHYAANGKEELLWTSGQIAMSMDNYFGECSPEGGIRYQILGNLGSFDITVLAISDNLSELIKLPDMLREVKPDPKVGERDGEPFIEYSSSFVAYGLKCEERSIDLDCGNNLLNVYLHFAAFNPYNDDKLVNYLSWKIEKELGCKSDNQIYSKIIGEYSLEAHIKNLTAKDVLNLFKIDILNINDDKYHSFFRSVYSLVNYELKPQPLGLEENNRPFQLFGEDIDRKREKWKEMHVYPMVDMLYEVRNSIKKNDIRIPSELKHPFDRCVQLLIDLLNNDLKYYIGQQLAMLIIDAMEQAKNYYETSSSENGINGNWVDNIKWFIQKCTLFLSSAHPINSNLLQDGNESQDEVDSTLKVFFAFQQFVKSITSVLNYRKENVNTQKVPKHVFIAVGAENGFRTREFIWLNNQSSKKERVDGDGSILGIDVPSVSSLSLRTIKEVFSHETAHSVALKGSGENGSVFFEVLYETVFGYCIQFMLLNRHENEGLSNLLKIMLIRERDKISHMFHHLIYKHAGEDTDNKVPGTPPDCLFERGISLETFKFKYGELIEKAAYDEDETFLNERKALQQHLAFFHYLCDVCVDARADILMTRICNYGVIDYFKFMRRYSDDNLRSRSDISSTWFHIRLSAVLYAFYLEYPDSARVEFINWWDEQCEKLDNDDIEFITPCLDSIPLTSSLGKYLNGLMATFDNCMNEIRDDTDAIEGRKLIKFMQSISKDPEDTPSPEELETEIWLYVNAWFRGLRQSDEEWEKRTKQIREVK